MSANLENSPAATGQRKVNSHSNPKEGQMPKNVQTTIQLHSFHMGAKLCSKSIKRGFSSMQTENFQINKLGLGKAEEPEMKLPTSLDHRESQGIWENIYCSFIDCTKAFDSVDHNKLWKILKEIGIPTTIPVSWETCVQTKKQHLEPYMEQWTGSRMQKENVKSMYCHPAFSLICRVYHAKYQAG